MDDATEAEGVALPSSDWERLAMAGWVAHSEALLTTQARQAGKSLPAWSELSPLAKEAWMASSRHILQTWLALDFRGAIQDDDLLENAARLAALGKRGGMSTPDCIRHMVAFVPIALIEPEVLCGGCSGEIFFPEEPA